MILSKIYLLLLSFLGLSLLHAVHRQKAIVLTIGVPQDRAKPEVQHGSTTLCRSRKKRSFEYQVKQLMIMRHY